MSPPLEAAAEGGHLQVMEMLLEAGAELRPSVLRAAAGVGVLAPCVADQQRYQQQHDVVEYLVEEHDLDPDGGSRGPSPLLCAAWSGNEQLMELLLDHGADPDHGGQIGISLATWAFTESDAPEISQDLHQELFPFVVEVDDLRPSEDGFDPLANLGPGNDGTLAPDEAVGNVPPLVGADPDRAIEGALNPGYST